MLAEQMEKGKRKSKRAVHLFAGLTYCSCGGKMYDYTSSPTKYLCQECRNKIPIADLEAVFHEQLKNFFFSPNEIASHLEEANEAIRQKAELLTSREAERAKLQGEIDKLHALYQAGAIDSAGFGTKYHPMAERLRQIDEELPALQAELDVMKISELSREEVIVGAQDLYTRWTSLPFEERRRVVETITDRIVISDGEVEIQLSYAPPIPPRRGGGSDGAPDDSDGGNPPLSSPVGNHGKSAAQQCGLAYPCGRRRRSVSRQRWPG
jgi:site-specific DNA recombinase